MASLLDIRNVLAKQGAQQAEHLSRQLAIPLPLVQAMLEQLIALGKVERVEQESAGCLSGGCKNCPQSRGCESTAALFRLRTQSIPIVSYL